MGDEEYKRGTNWWDSCSGDVRTGGASSESMGGGFRSMLEQGMEAEQFVDTSCSSVYGNFQPQQQGDGGYVANYETHHQFLKPNSMEDWNMPPPASSFFPLAMQQHQINIPCFHQKPQHTSGPGRKTSGSSSEQTTTTTTTTAAGKRSRNEASSALPPFKVRKEKMGDRITALQQLVSPFGKTDTASVLSEAIEYIKFLHEQVNVLSTPYLKSGASLQHQQSSDKSKDPEGPRQDLRSRGLCLVPVSSTFPVAHGRTVDFWTPTFGGTFR